jgi:O-antigen/teichoic acid export membrane protein
MGIVMLIIVPTILVGNYAFAIGKQSQWAWITAAGFVVSIPLHLVLIPYTDRHYGNGALGAAIVFAATELLIFAVAVSRTIPTLFDRSLVVSVAKAVSAGLIMLLASYPLRSRFLVIPILVGAVVYIGLIAALRVLPAEDRALLATAARKVTERLRPGARST